MLIHQINSTYIREYSSGDDVSPVMFLLPTHPSRMEKFPSDMDDRYQEAIVGQEQLLAARSDLVVFANDGSWNQTKHRHLDRLLRQVGGVIIWNPPGVEDAPPSETKPGVVTVSGGVPSLVYTIFYLLLVQARSS